MYFIENEGMQEEQNDERHTSLFELVDSLAVMSSSVQNYFKKPS